MMKRLIGTAILLLACAFGLQACGLPQKKTTQETKKDMKTLIVYFSFTAGNTKSIAEKIQKEIGGDIVRLETVKPYPKDYETVVSQGQREVERGYKLELKPLGVDVKDYDRIIVGSPTWWYKMAPAVLTFLSSNDFSGKEVVPFMTNAEWPGTVIKDMTAEAKKHGATVSNAHEFRFSSDSAHYDRMETHESELTQWINQLKK